MSISVHGSQFRFVSRPFESRAFFFACFQKLRLVATLVFIFAVEICVDTFSPHRSSVRVVRFPLRVRRLALIVLDTYFSLWRLAEVAF